MDTGLLNFQNESFDYNFNLASDFNLLLSDYLLTDHTERPPIQDTLTNAYSLPEVSNTSLFDDLEIYDSCSHSDNVSEPDPPSSDEDGFVDVEALDTLDIIPILQAPDPITLLEKFEATECDNVPVNLNSDTTVKRIEVFDVKKEVTCESQVKKMAVVSVASSGEIATPEACVATRQNTKTESKRQIKKRRLSDTPSQDLIERINKSSKRKKIALIDPIPTKLCGKRIKQNLLSSNDKKISNASNQCMMSIKHDHDYCSIVTPKPQPVSGTAIPLTECSKINNNSSTISAKFMQNGSLVSKDANNRPVNEDKIQSLCQQPVVKTTDGKLMVSLLKRNTIKPNQATPYSPQQQIKEEPNETPAKKKLNLEEYKKRRTIKITRKLESSQCVDNDSDRKSIVSAAKEMNQNSNTGENDTLKWVQHQEKMMKMAAELLQAKPHSLIKDELDKKVAAPKVNGDGEIISITPTHHQPVMTVAEVPAHLEMKTTMSVACNTNRVDDTLLRTVEQIEQIRPLLHQASDKITSNSFITSLIENIPKLQSPGMIDSNGTSPSSHNGSLISDNVDAKDSIIRENKVIVYLKKDRKRAVCKEVACQTIVSLVGKPLEAAKLVTPSRYRRRQTSIEDGYNSPHNSQHSSSSVSSFDDFDGDNDSVRSSSSIHNRYRPHSRSSSCSSVSASSYRTASPGQRHLSMRWPRKNYDQQEHLREVEERRVVYVGRLLKGTTTDDLRKRFAVFGPINNISVHFRNYGHHYGFVTFVNKQDAYAAVEHGNDGHVYPRYDLSFGGRRIFCKANYSDLDDMREHQPANRGYPAAKVPYEILLKAAREDIRNRKFP